MLLMIVYAYVRWYDSLPDWQISRGSRFFASFAFHKEMERN